MIKLSVCIPVWNQKDLVLRALDHIPRRDDIEVIVRDDGSTDNTLPALIQYEREHPELRLTVYGNGKNQGGAYTCNRLIDAASGEWIHFHDSDDYVLTEMYDRMITEWLTAYCNWDIVTMDMEVNSGERLPVNEHTQRGICAQIARFIRRAFLADIRYREGLRWAYDMHLNNEMLERNPRIAFSGVMAYHYNFPREGSLTDLHHKGLLS